MYYKELTQKQIDDHADWYESITFVDRYGNELPVVLTEDTSIDYDGDREE